MNHRPRRRWRDRLIAVGLLLFVMSQPVAAGTIQMTLATRLTTGATYLRVEIDLSNSGDEPALDVRPTVEFQGRLVAGDTMASLPPATPQTAVVEVPFAGEAAPRGRWPVLVRVAYLDGSQRRFEAIHADVAVFSDESTGPVVRVSTVDLSVAAEADGVVRVEREGDVGPIRVAFAAPAGLVVTPQVVTLDADDAAAVSVRILNAGLPVGSRVPVVAVAEYDTPEEHRTVTAVSMVEIVEPGDGSRLGVTALLLGATLLAWVVIVAVAAARRRHAS